ncbi:hypothetical protein Q5P01_024458 [Channa striata]|uniref:AKNA domain-containing protein n=1 Tax=Channa striata TaxID=64152 RepID=A0AA88IR01_CHASR|nr:hypothetical protein Q5P01_024458 [Channa striata]
MERRKTTTAGVLVWTPAPACTSSTSSVISEDVWEDERGEPVEKDDDFVSQMDDNGIIGLSEALENVELSKTCGDAEADCNPDWFHMLVTPEKTHPSGREKDTPSEQLCCNLSTHLSVEKPSTCDITGSLKTWTGDKQGKTRKDEEYDDKQGMSSGSRRPKNKNTSISGDHGATKSITESYIYGGENKNIRIEAETFPEMGFTESLPESLSSKISLKCSPRPAKSEREEQKELQEAATIPQQVGLARSHSSKSSPDKDPKTARARTTSAELNVSRKDLLSYRKPDFSKVEPRVRFPKSGYKPPKSRLSVGSEFQSPGPPVLFKSPADIVKEVLMDTADGPPAPSASVPSLTVPEDFRSWQQATTLLEQLQEDYNRLLTKYAEAENTIDRLRLEAKVNLYSDPPRPSHSVQSATRHDALKFMTLDLSQAHKAEIKSSSPLNGHSCHQSLQVGEQLDKVLLSQANNFLQQLQNYGDNLKRAKLKPFEQIKGLSQLAEGLDSLERGYLLARDEHRRLQQQQGTRISKFDPERELEGLIYQCGLYVEELKDVVEEMQQEQPVCEAPPSPPPHPVLSSVASEGGEVLAHPQTPPVPLLVDPGKPVEMNVSSADEENHEKDAETDDEETLRASYFNPLTGKSRYVEQDFVTIMDDYQSFKELPKHVDHRLREGSLQSTDLGTYVQPGNKRQDSPSQRRENTEFQEILPQRKVKSDNRDVPSVHTRKQQTSRFTPLSDRAPTQSTRRPVQPDSSSKRRAVGKSHSSSLSSLGESTASERKNSKLQTESRRVLSQDGIISPETDSGFVGSESSNLSPAAAPCAPHQRVSESVSGHREAWVSNTQTGPVSASSSAFSPSRGHMDTESRGASNLVPGQPKKSSQCWISQRDESKSSSASSGLESDTTHSLCEEGIYADSIHSIHSSHPGSSPTVQHYHGDVLRALGLGQVVNHNEAMQSLQKEVSTLKEMVESLRNKNPLSSVRSSPSTQDKYSPHYTSTPHVRDRPESCVTRGRREQLMDDESEELRHSSRTRSASSCRQKSQAENLTGSELGLSTLRHQSLISRYTQTSATENCCSHTNTVHSRRTNPRQHRAVSIQVSETADEPDGSCQAPLSSHNSSHHRGQSQKTQTPTCHPAKSPDRVVKDRYIATSAPPALLQYMPVCPPPFLMYSLPVYVLPRNGTGRSAGVKRGGDVKEKTRRSLSADRQHSVDSSLIRAIRAAQQMKHTSRHMARSLASGLQYQEVLTQSCNY